MFKSKSNQSQFTSAYFCWYRKSFIFIFIDFFIHILHHSWDVQLFLGGKECEVDPPYTSLPQHSTTPTMVCIPLPQHTLAPTLTLTAQSTTQSTKCANQSAARHLLLCSCSNEHFSRALYLVPLWPSVAAVVVAVVVVFCLFSLSFFLVVSPTCLRRRLRLSSFTLRVPRLRSCRSLRPTTRPKIAQPAHVE